MIALRRPKLYLRSVLTNEQFTGCEILVLQTRVLDSKLEWGQAADIDDHGLNQQQYKLLLPKRNEYLSPRHEIKIRNDFIKRSSRRDF